MHTTPTSIRVFTHQDLPNTEGLVAQATALATAHGLGVELVAVDVDASQARAAGVIALPAIIAYSGSTEIARRECALAGRRTQRWFDRKVAPSYRSPALVPAMA